MTRSRDPEHPEPWTLKRRSNNGMNLTRSAMVGRRGPRRLSRCCGHPATVELAVMPLEKPEAGGTAVSHGCLECRPQRIVRTRL